MQTLTDNLAHRQALRCAASMWQDEEGRSVEVSFSALIGRLKHLVHGAPVYVVYVQGTAGAGFGDDYSIDLTVTVGLSENGELYVCPATDEEVEQAKQHACDQACEEFGC